MKFESFFSDHIRFADRKLFGFALWACIIALLVVAQPAFCSSETLSVGSTSQVNGACTTVNVTFEYAEKPLALGYRVELPDGYTYENVGGRDVPDVARFNTEKNTLEFAWIQTPEGSVAFNFTVRAIDGQAGDIPPGQALYRYSGEEKTASVKESASSSSGGGGCFVGIVRH